MSVIRVVSLLIQDGKTYLFKLMSVIHVVSLRVLDGKTFYHFILISLIRVPGLCYIRVVIVE